MKLYIIQEYFDDVICLKQHPTGELNKKGKPKYKPCGEKIRCARIIHAVTYDKKKAVELTKNPNWSYITLDTNETNARENFLIKRIEEYPDKNLLK